MNNVRLAVAIVTLCLAGCSAEGAGPQTFSETEVDPETPVFVQGEPQVTLGGETLVPSDTVEAPGEIEEIEKLGPTTYALQIRESEREKRPYIWSREEGFLDDYDLVIPVDRDLDLSVVEEGGVRTWISTVLDVSDVPAPSGQFQLRGDGFVLFLDGDRWHCFVFDEDGLREIVETEGRLLPNDESILTQRALGEDQLEIRLVHVADGTSTPELVVSDEAKFYSLGETVIVRDGSSWHRLEGESASEFTPPWDFETTPRPLYDADFENSRTRLTRTLAYQLFDDRDGSTSFWIRPDEVLSIECDGRKFVEVLGRYITIQCIASDTGERSLTVFDEELTELAILEDPYLRTFSPDREAIIIAHENGDLLSWTPSKVEELDGLAVDYAAPRWPRRPLLVGLGSVWVKDDGGLQPLPGALRGCTLAWRSEDDSAYAYFVPEQSALVRWEPASDTTTTLTEFGRCESTFLSPNFERGIVIADKEIHEWNPEGWRRAIRADAISHKTLGEDTILVEGREPIIGREGLSQEEIEARESEGAE